MGVERELNFSTNTFANRLAIPLVNFCGLWMLGTGNPNEDQILTAEIIAHSLEIEIILTWEQSKGQLSFLVFLLFCHLLDLTRSPFMHVGSATLTKWQGLAFYLDSGSVFLLCKAF